MAIEKKNFFGINNLKDILGKIKKELDKKYDKKSGGIPKADLDNSVQTSLGKADTALQSFTETDPTVPAWAKAASKPTYTAAEVGALPSTTVIPDISGKANKSGDTFTGTVNVGMVDGHKVVMNTSGEITNYKSTTNYVYADTIQNDTNLSSGLMIQSLNNKGLLWSIYRDGTTDLKPSGYATEKWVTDKGYLTGITKAMVTTALGYTPPTSDTDTKVTQTAVGSDYTNWRPLIIGSSNSASEGFSPTTVTDGTFATANITVQPSSGTVRATNFKGKINGYTIEKSVPSNAVFTDTNTWRPIGTGASDAAAGNHTHSQYLTTHQDISGKLDKFTSGGIAECAGGGNYWYCRICTINITSSYINRPVVFELSGRGRMLSRVTVRFQNTNSTDPTLTEFYSDFDDCYYIKKTATSTWELYTKYSETWGNCVLHRITGAGANIGITVNMTNASSLPSDYTSVTYGGNVGYARGAGSVAWTNVSGRPSNISSFTNDSGYITGITKAMVTTALGYTPPTSDTNTWRPIGTGATDAAAGNHTHSYLPLSGGTLTGDLKTTALKVSPSDASAVTDYCATYLSGTGGGSANAWYLGKDGLKLGVQTDTTRIVASCGGTITFGKNDNYGIFTGNNNYCSIGASDKRFYRSYINYMYGAKTVYTSNANTSATTYNGTIYAASLTADRNYNLPDKSGTIGLALNGTITAAGGASLTKAKLTKVGDLAFIQFVANLSTAVSGGWHTIATVPTDFRPSVDSPGNMVCTSASSSNYNAMVIVTTSGNVQLYQYGGTSVKASWVNVNLAYSL